MESWAKEHEVKGEKGTLLLLYVQPGASKTAVKGEFASTPTRLKVSIAASPTEGEANRLLIKFLSETLGVPKSQVHILSGETSRQKNVWIQRMEPMTAVVCLSE